MITFDIQPLSEGAMTACRYRIDHLTKPLNSLAKLEEMAIRLAGILDVAQPGQVPFAMLVVGGEEADTEEETFQIYEKFQKKSIPTKAVATKINAPVMLLNVGNEKMEPSIVEEYLEGGRALAMQLKKEGAAVVGLGNIPHAIDTDMLSCISKVKEAMSEESWISLLGETHPILVTLVGVVLGAAECHMGIFFDNDITGLAAMLAAARVPLIKEYVFASANFYTEAQAQELAFLDKEAPLHYGFTWATGLGSAMGLSTLRAALHMLNDMKTFEEAGVTVAEDGPGSKAQQ